ncbi:hypothetical protein [Maricaulis maris]|uniref:Uncharacterized protein n=1 Tax=Maricaulis maris TaxID=74318 RepID=A0A495DJ90_9PROT|nr:hypothetical protein [Maricaulis maris]RKR02691.1 hypothetical protein C7435_0630 [Maricaulis maris]
MSWQANSDYALKEFHALLVWLAIGGFGGLAAVGAAAIQISARPDPPFISLGFAWWFAMAAGLAFIARLLIAVAAAIIASERLATKPAEAVWLQAIGAVAGIFSAMSLTLGVSLAVQALTAIAP